MRRFILAILFTAPFALACGMLTPAQRETAKVWADAYEATKCNALVITPEDQARCLHFNDNGRKMFGLEGK